MKFLIKLIASFLIVWLPIVGYPAQASVCFETSTAAFSSHEHLALTSGSDRIDDAKAPCAKMQTACQTGTYSACCGTLGILGSPHAFIAAMALAPSYRPMSRVLMRSSSLSRPNTPQKPLNFASVSRLTTEP
jgi:hypothetical protein